jgi:predicted RNA-binding protein with PUA-like domain
MPREKTLLSRARNPRYCRAMSKQYWLMKSEPDVYSWDDLVRDGIGMWDGVRNHTAKLNMKAMQVGDEALFYHSNIGKECVGVMTITETAFPDPTAEEGAPWVVVRVAPLRPLPQPVTLATIKADPALQDMDLIRLGRLSVGRVKPAEWKHILTLAGA